MTKYETTENRNCPDTVKRVKRTRLEALLARKLALILMQLQTTHI